MSRESPAAESIVKGVDLQLAFNLILVLACFVGVGWAVLHGYRRLRLLAQAAQERVFEGLRVTCVPVPGTVAVLFHTYYGFLAFVVQAEHRFWARPDEAWEALRRLHRFNLRWGLLAYGAFFIPLVSYVNYLAQQRAVSRQEAALLI
jgi:hypothetical protein